MKIELVKKICRKSLALLLLGFVLLLVVNRTVYTHSHILSDGTVLTHAHPYDTDADGNPFKSHQHNSIELLIFSTFNFIGAILFIFSSALFVKKTKHIFANREDNYCFTCWRFILGRAPPRIIWE